LKEPERKKGRAGKVILWIFLVLVLAVLIGGGVLYYKYPELCIEKYNCCKAEIKRVIFKQVPAAAEKTESNAAPVVAEKTEDKVVPAVLEKKAEDKSVPAGVEKPESKVAPAAAEKVGSISGDRN